MNILSIGTIDNKGGAANVAWELRKRLKADGHTVNTFARYKYSNEPDVFVIPRRRWQDWLVKIFANDLWFGGSVLDTPQYKEADIIHCHNLHSNFFRFKDLIKMSREKPVIWTLHDMWAFTGFAYNSVTLRNPNKKRFLLFLWDNTPFMYWIKKKTYERSNITVVAVSDWLKNEAEKSILKDQKILRIYNGIDTQTFRPHDKIQIRNRLGLPNKKIIGCGIKGWIDSQKIIDSCADDDDVYFVAIGHDNIKTKNKNFKSLPPTSDRKIMAEYLSSLDIFMHPTPEEAFGLISAEAMSCGTPVVTYDTDALPEIVSHKETGYVSAPTPEDMKKGLEYILSLSPSAYAAMSSAARKRIETSFNVDRMYREYLELYQKLTSEGK